MQKLCDLLEGDDKYNGSGGSRERRPGIKEDLIDKVSLKQKFKGHEGASHEGF